MADTEIPPHRCTYCLQALPEDYNQDLFGSNLLQPHSDDASNFATETQTILRYASAVASMCQEAGTKSEDTLYELHMLMGELTEEAARRLERAQDALAIVWERTHDADTGVPKATPTSAERGA